MGLRTNFCILKTSFHKRQSYVIWKIKVAVSSSDFRVSGYKWFFEIALRNHGIIWPRAGFQDTVCRRQCASLAPTTLPEPDLMGACPRAAQLGNIFLKSFSTWHTLNDCFIKKKIKIRFSKDPVTPSFKSFIPSTS